VPKTHGKGTKTLGKGFAECNTRQSQDGKKNIGKENFAECFPSNARQNIFRVLL
jgi:hypothetical protein